VHQEDSNIYNMAYYIQHTEKWSYHTKRTQNAFHWQYLKPVTILTGMHWNTHYWLSQFCRGALPVKITAFRATDISHNTAVQLVNSACCTPLSSGTKFHCSIQNLTNYRLVPLLLSVYKKICLKQLTNFIPLCEHRHMQHIQAKCAWSKGCNEFSC